MIAQTLLRDIRENRKKLNQESLHGGRLTKDEYKDFLIIDPHFAIDIVSLMRMWSKKYIQEQQLKETPFVKVLGQWIASSKDLDEQKNRRNGIQALIKNGIVLNSLDCGSDMTVIQFTQRNSLYIIKGLISAKDSYADCTKKTYKVLYGSLWKYIWKFINGSSGSGRYKKIRMLKRGVRPLELSEMAFIFDELEKGALRSLVGLRDLLVMRLILYAGEGVEIKSICSLQRGDINFAANTVKIKLRHAKKKREFECSRDFMRLLKSYLGRKKKNLFENIHQEHLNKRLERIAKRASIENITLKSIQRTYWDLLKRHGLVN